MHFSTSALFDALEVGWFLGIALYVRDIKIANGCMQVLCILKYMSLGHEWSCILHFVY